MDRTGALGGRFFVFSTSPAAVKKFKSFSILLPISSAFYLVLGEAETDILKLFSSIPILSRL